MSAAITPHVAVSRPRLDIPTVLVKRWSTVLAGCVLAGVVAAVYWALAPRVYQSTVEILVMRKDPAMTAVTDPSPSDGRADVAEDVLATHMRLLGSRRVVQNAIKTRELDKLPGILSHLDRETTVSDYIVDHLDIGRGGKGQASGAQVVHAKFRHTDEEETQLILTAVVDSYQQFLDETFSNVGSTVFTLYEKQHTELSAKLEEARAEYDRFRASVPVFLSKKSGIDVYENQLVELTESKSLVEQQRNAAQSRLDLLVNAMEGPDAEAFTDVERLALVDERHVERLALMVDVERGDSLSEAFQANQPARTEMANVEFDRLVSLQLEADEIQNKLGPMHPRRQTIGESIEKLQGVVARPVSGDFRVRDIDAGRVVASYRTLLENDLKHLDRQLESLDEQIERVTAEARDASKYELENQMLLADLQARQQSHSAVLARMPELGMTTQNSGYLTEIIAPVSMAEVAWPRLLQLGSLALALGLCGGVGGALYREMTDRSFESPAEVSTLLGTPVLGVISKLGPAARKQLGPLDSKLISALAPESLDAQSIRMIRTALMHSAVGEGGGSVVQFTSPTIGQGTSLVMANVAVALAAAGKRVLVVDANMRRSEQHRLFGIELAQGLSELLSDQAELPETISSTSVVNLELLPAGGAPVSPAELLAMPRFEQLLSSLRDQYEFILIDTPSTLSVSDALSVAHHADGVVLVLAMRSDAVPSAQQSVEVLQRFDARLIGTIVNDLENRVVHSAGHYANALASSNGNGHVRHHRLATPEGASQLVAPVREPVQS